MKIFSRKLIDKIFEIGVLVKALFGFFEIMAGIFIAVSGQMLIDNFLMDMAMDEIAHDPKDFIATHFIYWSVDIFTGSKIFSIVYLIFHGIINIFLVAALLKKKLWAYHWAMGAFCGFILYQIYRYLHTNSLLLLCLTIFDIFFVFIIFLEYRKLKNKT